MVKAKGVTNLVCQGMHQGQTSVLLSFIVVNNKGSVQWESKAANGGVVLRIITIFCLFTELTSWIGITPDTDHNRPNKQ